MNVYRCVDYHYSWAASEAGEVGCLCGLSAHRCLDFSGISVGISDPWRASWLNDQKMSTRLQQQGRTLDPLAPKDRFEKRAIEAATGRIYIGDDQSSLKASSRRAIEKAKDKGLYYDRSGKWQHPTK